ncbi:MAG TPA: Na+/H+ antiporter NhaA, partial [Firmicutes bacterium]|nr:Na+/H+ antiporter NhaA [Bacillota bacterium]
MTRTIARRPQVAVNIASAFDRFTRSESSGGILLMICAVLALAWANSPWAASYFQLWEMKGGLSIGEFSLNKSLHHWINDGLMVLFFFVVGLEIKREILVGELKSISAAMLPISAAIGGMAVPALLYFALNQTGESAAGWGIPMATDIAFALAVLALLGKRVPLSLKVFLTALAIIDDLGAVLVIALFYTEQIQWTMLLIAAGVLFAAFLLNWLGVQSPLPYAIVGIVLWYAVLQSGVHATVAGVILALAIPTSPRIDRPGFIERVQGLLDDFTRHDMELRDPDHSRSDPHSDLDVVHSMRQSCVELEPPLERFEHALTPWVAYLIMPLFALANAGVSLQAGIGTAVASTVAQGILLGLLAGKIAGISLFSWLAVKLRVARLPRDVNWQQILGAGLLCGIGFTMSLFIADLAFGPGQLLDHAKIGILSASAIAGIIGYFLLAGIDRRSLPGVAREHPR